ncbi:MAG: hypothetical protein DRP64_05450, partial [Verrucomicrobia bacterium]
QPAVGQRLPCPLQPLRLRVRDIDGKDFNHSGSVLAAMAKSIEKEDTDPWKSARFVCNPRAGWVECRLVSE